MPALAKAALKSSNEPKAASIASANAPLGAPPPEGVTLHGRWFTASHSKGFMLVEADDSKPLFRWVSEWADVIDFEIEPVVRDEEAAPILREMM